MQISLGVGTFVIDRTFVIDCPYKEIQISLGVGKFVIDRTLVIDRTRTPIVINNMSCKSEYITQPPSLAFGLGLDQWENM